jgi:DNA-binding LacI/PurR family transcriptional regulator
VKPPPPLVTTKGEPAHRRVSDGLRSQILSGAFLGGAQLPAIDDLAANWQTSRFTIQTALKVLVKEGWIYRRHGAGTYLADPKSRFLRAGIYHGVEIGSNDQPAFGRNLHFSLLKKFEELKKGTEVFIDSRRESDQTKVLPQLAEAIQQQRIQCLVAPTLNPVNAISLARLTLPNAFTANAFSRHWADFDLSSLLRQSLEALAEQGCRSVGLMSHVFTSDFYLKEFYATFKQVVSERALHTQPSWLRAPNQTVSDLERYGYEAFKRFWKLKEKPEGLVVYPDTVAKGVVLAILEIGAAQVAKRVKLVFHRNSHVPILCPLPVTWAVSNEDKLAEALVELILKQFNGEAVSRVLLPYSMEKQSGY